LDDGPSYLVDASAIFIESHLNCENKHDGAIDEEQEQDGVEAKTEACRTARLAWIPGLLYLFLLDLPLEL
jgi:hypothetical protein